MQGKRKARTLRAPRPRGLDSASDRGSNQQPQMLAHSQRIRLDWAFSLFPPLDGPPSSPPPSPLSLSRLSISVALYHPRPPSRIVGSLAPYSPAFFALGLSPYLSAKSN